MRKNNEKVLAEQKKAMIEARKAIDECIKQHSKTLKFGYNLYLNVFPEEIRELTWLTSLSVICTDIRVLPDWIGELKNLQTLDLSTNQKIKKLPDNLSTLKHLKKLVLGNTGILRIPVLIGQLVSLEVLDISIYGIKEVPQCILDLPKLRRIETRGYLIDHLPALIEKQHELNLKEFFRRIKRCKKRQSKKLDLSFLYLNELPEELEELQWITELNLVCNNLARLPDWIGNFPELAKLYVESNELTELPVTIGNLKKLKKIRLSGNLLESLPETFGGLESLESFILIDFHDNPSLDQPLGQGLFFACLPESFGKLSALKQVVIMESRLTRLPDSFGDLISLKDLSLDLGTQCDFYFPATMKKLKKLREISLSAFDRVPDFIGELKNLTTLDISHNRLYTLPEFIGNLTKLKSLYLHSTWITEVPYWIVNLKNLETLDISSNDITVTPEIVLKELHKLKNFAD
jgi:Leucine-rich repeat (LRR) protein